MAASDHSFVVDSERNLYGCGLNFQYVLGLPKLDYQYSNFTSIDIKNVLAISSSISHTLALCQDDNDQNFWMKDLMNEKK